MSAPALPFKERRCSLRWPAKRTAKVLCRRGTLGLGPNIALAVFDLSEAGVRLRVKSPLANGQEIEVGLEAVGQPRPITLPARVAWSAAAEEGSYWVGARFQKLLSYRDLLNLTSQSQ